MIDSEAACSAFSPKVRLGAERLLLFFLLFFLLLRRKKEELLRGSLARLSTKYSTNNTHLFRSGSHFNMFLCAKVIEDRKILEYATLKGTDLVNTRPVFLQSGLVLSGLPNQQGRRGLSRFSIHSSAPLLPAAKRVNKVKGKMNANYFGTKIRFCSFSSFFLP